MFILNSNSKILENAYKCNEKLAKYLIYDCNIPLLAIDKDKYLFSRTKQLDNVLNNLPLWIKILKYFN
jgi:hypothetical protein